MRKFNKKIPLWLYIVVLIITLISGVFKLFTSSSTKQQVQFIECIDGDTVKLKIGNKIEKVRFLGIDAPEIAHENKPADPYGNEAAEYTCKALKTAKLIHLEYEETKTDKYNRVLAWVFVDQKLLNEDLVKQGLARVRYLYDRYQYTPQLKMAEKEAKTKKLNIWK